MGGWLLAAGESPITPFFGLLALVLVMAVVVSLLLTRARQSLLVGYFLVGVLIANSGLLQLLGIDHDAAVIGHLAELGVILLMFTLGIEFSLSELRHLWRIATLGGGLQVTATGLLAGLVAHHFGHGAAESAAIGVAVALSSTAVAMKSLEDLGQPHNPGARTALGIALFQDIFVIAFILILPALFGLSDGGVAGGIGIALVKGLTFLGAAIAFGKFVLPHLFHAVARTRSRELFTLTVIGLCSAVALAGEALDLSLSLGAFAAGLVVSESMYSHRIMSEILPFKDLFLTIFFVSVGLLIDLGELLANWPAIAALTVAILLVKGLVVFGAARVVKVPARPALLAAAALASTGEFSIVLLSQAHEFHPLDSDLRQVLLASTAISMGIVPTLMKSAGPFARLLEERGIFRAHQRPPAALEHGEDLEAFHDHAVICGHGPVGRALNEALRRCGIDTLVLELNAQTVRQLLADNQPVLFADATHPEALDLAAIQRARLVAFTFPAVDLTCAAVPLVRERNPGISIFGRAKFPSEVERLQRIGVTVIHDEMESAAAMIAHAMSSYQRAELSAEEIREIVEK